MKIPFSKMEGLGNDFMVIDALDRPLRLDTQRVQQLADRRTGVGFDQLLLLEAPRDKSHTAHYRIFNADGGEVEQCGNGARCVSRLLVENGRARGPQLSLESSGRVLVADVSDLDSVRVNMGVPEFEPTRIPFEARERALTYELDVDGRNYEIGVVSMGNPHAILDLPDVDIAPVAELGPRIERHLRFPQRVNVNFAQWLDRTHVKLRVFERGTGETLACGSGACATTAWGRLAGWLDESVEVALRGGRLVISWPGEGQPMWMRGPANRVYDGTIEL
ncbi:MAG: diaminopimelate epimerase [Gammaproteobacteria bacterium]|nr:diaminopimelate epimerase [Gammaproteobacteria bacterium]MDE1886649.1 diaminopimelate epimerase [Gammaproteobacteria bacterium]